MADFVPELYRCPYCHGPISSNSSKLKCRDCRSEFPHPHGYIDFIPEHNSQNDSWFVRNFFEVIPPIYQSLYFPVLYRLGTLPESQSMTEEVNELVNRTNQFNGTVLDVACGTGYLTRKLAEQNDVTCGLDRSRGMLKQAIRKTPDTLNDKLQYNRGDARTLPYRDNRFDAVTCSGAFYFFPDLSKVLEEISRVLKDGGRLAGMTVVTEGVLEYDVSRRLVEWYQNLHPYIVYDVDEFTQILNHTGFSSIEYSVYGCVILFDAKYQK